MQFVSKSEIFTPIIPYRARRKKTRQLSDWASGKVQASFTGVRGYRRICVWVGVDICEFLGWETGEKMAVSMDEKCDVILIKKAENPVHGFTLQAGKYCRSISFPIELSRKFKRKIVSFNFGDEGAENEDSLIIKLKSGVKNEQ